MYGRTGEGVDERARLECSMGRSLLETEDRWRRRRRQGGESLRRVISNTFFTKFVLNTDVVQILVSFFCVKKCTYNTRVKRMEGIWTVLLLSAVVVGGTPEALDKGLVGLLPQTSEGLRQGLSRLGRRHGCLNWLGPGVCPPARQTGLLCRSHFSDPGQAPVPGRGDPEL